jgi:arabinofuranosyltransferase
MSTQSPEQSRARSWQHGTQLRTRLLGAALISVGLLYVATVLRTGWTGDDAFITLRAVDNFTHGYGLVSNPPERVLGFTNPLWALALVLPYSFGLGGYATAIVTGVLVSTAAALVVLLCSTPKRAAAIVAGVWLTASAAYVDFSTSGLENPLAHFLLALFFSAFIGGRLSAARAWSWALAALIVVNRQDHALLIIPALSSMLFERADANQTRSALARVRARLVRPLLPVVRALLLGGAPLWGWLGFALVYYGFPFPNTAYAKLNLQLSDGVLIRQGFAYFIDSWQRDPVTLSIIALAFLQLAFDRSREALMTGAGMLLYLAYVVRIGGDFMAGRFFTAPFLVAVVWLAGRGLSRLSTPALVAAACSSLVVLWWFPISYRRVVKSSDCIIGESGIVSERHCYSDYTALVDNLGTGKYMQHGRWKRGIDLRRGGRRVLTSTNVGMMGYAAGPLVHIIDLMALTEPLLARIPYRASGGFRIGHFQRDAPLGYEESVRTGRNQIADRCLHAYYDQLSRVIYGPLFTAARWRAIVELNLGRHDHLLQQPCRSDAPIKLAPVPRPRADTFRSVPAARHGGRCPPACRARARRCGPRR